MIDLDKVAQKLQFLHGFELRLLYGERKTARLGNTSRVKMKKGGCINNLLVKLKNHVLSV